MGILRLLGIGLCWGTLLLMIGGAVGGFVLYSQLNAEVQKHVLAELQQRYPGLEIRVGSAQIVENRGLTIKDVEFSVGHSRKLLYIGELVIECPVTLQSLYQKNPPISRIVMKNPILRASRSTEGTFPELQLLASGNDDSLFLFPEGSKPISVEIVNGMLLYDDVRHPAPPLRLSGINLAVTPEVLNQTRRHQIQQISIKGTADGDWFRRLDIEVIYLPDTHHWQFTANCRQFDWSDDLWNYLPPYPYAHERPLVQGRFDFNVSAMSDAAAKGGCRFAIGGTLQHGRIDFTHINQTWSDLSTRFEMTNDRIVIDKLTGCSDSARFDLSYVQEGLPFFGNPKRQAELTVNARDIRFDDELAEFDPFLSDELKRLLAQYDYEGTADVYAQLVCQNGNWHPKKFSMKISDLGFSYHAFPYRLDHLAGELFVDETASMYLRFTTKQNAPLKAVIEGQYHNLFADAAGKVEIVGEDVPIDAKLLRALPVATQRIVTSLQPAGKIKTRLTLELPPGDAPVNKQFDIVLDHISLRYDGFPYPLRDVTGVLHCDNDDWEFRDLRGTNGTAVVKGVGHLHPVGDRYHPAQEFILHISAEELPVDDQIAQALLQSEQRQLLQNLNANGKVNLAAQIHYRTDDRQLNLTFQAEPRPGLSIYPERFRYKIEDIAGTVCYENGRVFAETLTGTHRNTKLRSGLDCRFDASGQSVLRLAPLTVDQLQADRELLDALPKHIQAGLESMQITKPFNLSGGIEYQQTPQGVQAVRWDLNCILHQNNAKLGVPVENLFGIVRLSGHSFADQLQLNGELYLDSFMVSGFQITDVRGPFSFDNKRLRLGGAANRLTPEVPPQPLTGKFCGGTIRAEGWVVVDSGITYTINADLLGADLAKIAQVAEPMAQNTSGTLNCQNVNLRGIGTKWETVSGKGTIQLRDANIGGAPMMVRLFRELRIKPTDPNAGMFSSVDVNFRIEGLELFYDPIVFEGGLISMHGNGMVRLDNRHVDLMLKTRLGSRRMQIPLISDVVGGVSDQLVQLRITGPLTDPTITRLVVPEIQNVLQQIQPDDAIPPPPVSRNRLAPSRLFPWNPL